MERQNVLLIALLLLFLFSSGCARYDGLLDLRPDEAVELADIPFFPQQTNQCGPASLAMLLNYSGVAVSPEEVARLTFIPDVKGSLQAELLSGTRSFGRIPYVIDPDPQAIIAELKSGHPVLVLQNYGLASLPYFHYAVVIGITPDKTVVLRSGDNSRLVMSAASFLMSWQRSGSWGMIVLKPGELPGEGESRNYISAVDAYWQTEKRADAIDAYESALHRWPDDRLVLFAVATHYLQTGNNDAAEKSYRKLLALDAADVAAANNLADLLMQKGCFYQAMDLIDSTLEISLETGSPFLETLKATRSELVEKTEDNKRRYGENSACLE